MKKIIVLLIIFMIVFISIKNKETESIIPDSAIRFRVVANSNTVYDQNTKIQVRNTVQNYLLQIIKDTKNIDEVRKQIKSHEKDIYELTSNKLKEIGYDKDFKLHYGLNYFPKKKYKGLTYKEGNYESLVITLGKGNGDNFWCVLFPPLCLIEENSEKDEIEYKFYIKEIIDKYILKK